ncbi:MAG: hypothetical protein ACQET1_07815 [Gemmatimonadota bacterium]
MTRSSAPEPPPGSPGNPIQLPKDKKLLQKYYAGERLPSPMGGHLDVLGVREGEKGMGRVLLECNASSLRFVMEIPRATRAEKEKVKELVQQGGDPHCPRHGPYHPLSKSGKEWVCSLCAISYGKAG